MSEEIEIRTPQEVIAWTIRELKSKAGPLNEAAAMLEPRWKRGVTMMRSNSFMEQAAYAEVGDHVLYAVSVKDDHLKTAPPGASKTTWSLYVMPEHEAVAGGPAEDLSQAKRFAYLAYQATQGLIIGGDA